MEEVENVFEFPFSCPHCQQSFVSDIHDIGEKVCCPTCGKTIIIEPQGPCFDELNYKQKTATVPVDGIIRVVAGAGTGKTRVLIRRLVYLIQSGIPQEDILSVTFTNKAAAVMKKRAQQFLGSNMASRISTFHGFCHELLKEDIHAVNFPPNFTILDTEDQKQILQEIYDENEISGVDYNYKKALEYISKVKHKIAYIPYLTKPTIAKGEKFFSPKERSLSIEEIIFNEYLLKQRRNYCLDFDDLILFAIHILSKFPDIKSKWNDRIRYIQVDEFQDVSGTQWSLLTLLLGSQNNLFVVGDPDQNIYTWRGAALSIFLGLSDFAKGINRKFTDVILDDNYRSFQSILDVSNQMISHNTKRIHKNLHAVRGSGSDKPLFFHAKDNVKESEWIASQIKVLNTAGGVSFNHIAILLRGLSHSKVLEDALRKAGIPYQIINGLRFYERKEIKDALAYLRLIADGDDLSFKRIINEPPRGIGKSRLQILKSLSEQNGLSLWEAFKQKAEHGLFQGQLVKNKRSSHEGGYVPVAPEDFVKIIEDLREKLPQTTVSDILVEVLRRTGYEAYILQSGDEERKENLNELISGIIHAEQEAEERIDLHNYLNEIAIYAEKQEDPDVELVKIMTIHASKGQEFPFVFVPFFNEHIIPSAKAHSPDEIEEERRVAYVAFTRAEKQLFISNSEGSAVEHYLLPSRFLIEIEKEFLRVEGVVPASYWKEATEKITSLLQNQANISKFHVGDEIEHGIFGPCKIVNIDYRSFTLEIQTITGEKKRISPPVLQTSATPIRLGTHTPDFSATRPTTSAKREEEKPPF